MKEISYTRHWFNIIYPKELGPASPEALALCEMFIDSLIRTGYKEILCRVNSDLNYIECDKVDIKNILTLLLKTKKISAFYNQFVLLLHKSEDNMSSNYLGQLQMVKDNLLLSISIIEKKVFPISNGKSLIRDKKP